MRPQGGLPSDTVTNPKGKEQCHVGTLKICKQIHNPEPKQPKASRTRELTTQELQELDLKENELNSTKVEMRSEEQNAEPSGNEFNNT